MHQSKIASRFTGNTVASWPRASKAGRVLVLKCETGANLGLIRGVLDQAIAAFDAANHLSKKSEKPLFSWIENHTVVTEPSSLLSEGIKWRCKVAKPVRRWESSTEQVR